MLRQPWSGPYHGPSVSRGSCLLLRAEGLLSSGLVVVGHARQMVDPLSSPVPIALDATHRTSPRAASRPPQLPPARGPRSGGRWTGMPKFARHLELARPEPPPGDSCTSLGRNIVERIATECDGIPRCHHRTIEIGSANRAPAEEAPILIGLDRNTAHVTPCRELAEPVAGLRPASPTLPCPLTMLLVFRGVDTEQAHLTRADHKGVAVLRLADAPEHLGRSGSGAACKSKPDEEETSGSTRDKHRTSFLQSFKS